MAIKLVCTIPFGDYQKGDEVTDSDAVEKYLNTHPGHVVRVAYEPEPAPAPAPRPIAPAAPVPAVLAASDPT